MVLPKRILRDRHGIVAEEVVDARPVDRRLEPCRLGDEPVGELAPVTRAFDAEPVGIDPRICRDRRIEPGEHVAPLAAVLIARDEVGERSEEHTSELQSLMRISYVVFCLKKKKSDT